MKRSTRLLSILRVGLIGSIFLFATAEVSSAGDVPSAGFARTFRDPKDVVATETIVAIDCKDKPCKDVDLCDFIVIKKSDPDPFIAGAKATYEITVTNDTFRDLSTVVIDNFPSAFLNPTWTRTILGGGSPDADGFGNICDTIELDSKATAIYVVEGIIAPNADIEKKIYNVASALNAHHILNEDGPACCATDIACVRREVNLRVKKQVSDDNITYVDCLDVSTGQDFYYQIMVTNIGPSDAECVLVQDQFPAAMLDPTWSAQASGLRAGEAIFNAMGVGDIDEKIDYFPAGVTITYIVSGSLDPNIEDVCDDIVNEVCVLYEHQIKKDQAIIKPFIPPAEVCIFKEVEPECFVPGGQAKYTITVQNSGPNDAFGVVVSDPLFEQFFPGPNPSMCTRKIDDGPALPIPCGLYPIGLQDELDIFAGSTVVYTIKGTILHLENPCDILEVTNEATVTYRGNTCCGEDRVAVITTLIKPPACVTVEKKLLSVPLKGGKDATYEITVRNEGDCTAVDVILQDIFPEELENPVWQAEILKGDVELPQTEGVGDINLVFDIGPGACVRFTVVGGIDELAESVVNTARVLYPNNICECDATSTVDEISFPVADIRIKKSSDPNPLVPGHPATYTLTITNNGPGNAIDIIVQDELPLEFILDTIDCFIITGPETGSCGEFSENGGIVTGSVDLDALAKAKVVLNGTIKKSACDDVVNKASATYCNDSKGCPVEDIDRTGVKKRDVFLEIAFEPEEPICNVPTTLHLMVTNLSSIPIEDVMVTGFLPLGLEYVPNTVVGDGVLLIASKKWLVGELEGNESAHLALDVTFADFTFGGKISGSAKVTFEGQDELSGNNLAPFCIQVPDCPDKEDWH